MQRGVCQGCPLSCILFNIFINDLFHNLLYTSIVIPSSTSRKLGKPPLVITDLLFADDALGLATSKEELTILCAHIGHWTTNNKMKVGILKCGIMVFGSDGLGQGLLTCSLPDPWYTARLTIEGKPVPLVESYLYLGVTITPSLSTANLVASHFASGPTTVQSLIPYLCCIPLSGRLAVIRAIVLPRLLYHAEVYGMCQTLTDKMQSLLNLALQALIRIGPWSSLSLWALWKEFGILPICAIAAGWCIHAYHKLALGFIPLSLGPSKRDSGPGLLVWADGH